MEENIKTETEYIKGFNEGYTIAKFMPEFADKITQSVGPSDRSDGFKDGWKEYQMEKSKERYPDWLKNQPETKNPDSKFRDMDRDRE